MMLSVDLFFVVKMFCVKVLVNGEARLVSVCGGGAWEMALAKLMEEHIKANTIHKFVPWH